MGKGRSDNEEATAATLDSDASASDTTATFNAETISLKANLERSLLEKEHTLVQATFIADNKVVRFYTGFPTMLC